MYKRIIDKLKELSKNLHKDNKFEKKEKTSSYLAALKKIRASNKIENLTKIVNEIKTTMVSSVLGTPSAPGTTSTALAISTIETTMNQTKTQQPAQNNHRFS